MIALKNVRPRVRAVRLCQQCCSATAGADECSDELVTWAMRKCIHMYICKCKWICQPARICNTTCHSCSHSIYWTHFFWRHWIVLDAYIFIPWKLYIKLGTKFITSKRKRSGLYKVYTYICIYINMYIYKWSAWAAESKTVCSSV